MTKKNQWETEVEYRNTFVVRSNGEYHAVTNRTDLSDRAVIEAVEWMNSGEEYPWLLFFNCRGFATGSYYTGYAQIEGNYFSIAEPSLPIKIGEEV